MPFRLPPNNSPPKHRNHAIIGNARRFIARRAYLRAMESPEQSQDLQAEEKPPDEIPPDPGPAEEPDVEPTPVKRPRILGELLR